MIFPPFSVGYYRFPSREDSENSFIDDNTDYGSVEDSNQHSKHDHKKEVYGKVADF